MGNTQTSAKRTNNDAESKGLRVLDGSSEYEVSISQVRAI